MRWVQAIRRRFRVLLDGCRRIDGQHLERVDGHQNGMIGSDPGVDKVLAVSFPKVVNHETLVDRVNHDKIVLDSRQGGMVEGPKGFFRGSLDGFLGARLELHVSGIVRLLDDAGGGPSLLFVAHLFRWISNHSGLTWLDSIELDWIRFGPTCFGLIWLDSVGFDWIRVEPTRFDLIWFGFI